MIRTDQYHLYESPADSLQATPRFVGTAETLKEATEWVNRNKDYMISRQVAKDGFMIDVCRDK